MHLPILRRFAVSLATVGLVACSAVPVLAQQKLTYQLAPYDLCKANWTSANYLQALYNPRWKTVAFAQDCFGDREGVGGLYFVDDMGRVVRSLVEEAEFSPVARVEAVAAMARGLMAAAVPHAPGRSFFVIDGRQAIYLQPRDGDLVLNWLQDTSTPQMWLHVETRSPGGDWSPLRFTDPPRSTPRRSVCSTTGAGPVARATSFAGTLDRAPEVAIESAGPIDVRVTLSRFGAPRVLHLGSRQRIDASAGMPGPVASRDGYVLLQADSLRDNAASTKVGWERADLWNALDTMLMVAMRTPGAMVGATGDGAAWTTVQVEWRGVRKAALCVAPFLEVEPSTARYVFDASASVARTGCFGLKPYLPVRTSNGFYGGVTGLASAAWMLQRYGHPLAPRARAAAIAAFQAVIESEQRGYHGVYEYNLIEAALYLRRLAPGRFDYARWVRTWADRDLARCPETWATPPWTDTALRAVRGWQAAYDLTGDRRYRAAVDRAMAQFALPPKTPYDSFLWRGENHPWNGYDCTAAAMLMGMWGRMGDPRAEDMVRKAGDRYMSDFGFVPYQAWTCDDLLPYYVGHSLRAVYGAKPWSGAQRRLGLREYASYDRDGKVTMVPSPAGWAQGAATAR